MTDAERAAAPSPAPADLRTVVKQAINDISRVGYRYHYANDLELQNPAECADAALSAISAAGYVILPREPIKTSAEERFEWIELFRRVIKSNWSAGSDESLQFQRRLQEILRGIGVEVKLFSGPRMDQVEMIDTRAAHAAKEPGR